MALTVKIGGVFLICFLIMGCEQYPESGYGMVLPAGDMDAGKTAFVELRCNQCHTISGVSLPKHAAPAEHPLELGGEVYLVKTYGDLITAITNPDHIISPKYKDRYDKNFAQVHSPMQVNIEEMSVRQLIDLVTFLNAQYKELQPEYIEPPGIY